MRVLASAFWSPDAGDAESWLATRVSHNEELKAQDVPCGGVPPMLRRRMSVLSRMGIHVAMRADPDWNADFQVFASQHGEIARSRKLIDSIIAESDISPTDFSLSVHNTTAGLYSLIHHSTAPAVSIAAGASTFAAAWIEAASWIEANPRGTVLLVNHDDVLPVEYAGFVPELLKPFALALLLESGSAGRKSDAPDVRIRCEPSECGESLPMGPAFARWLQAGYADELRLTADGSSFVWSAIH